jgi:lipoprotein-anchoring transpeptidase ErfK/SrfK
MMKSALAAISLLLVTFPSLADAGQRYATPGPVLVDPVLTSSWSNQLRVRPRPVQGRMVATAPRYDYQQPMVRQVQIPRQQQPVRRLLPARQPVYSLAPRPVYAPVSQPVFATRPQPGYAPTQQRVSSGMRKPVYSRWQAPPQRAAALPLFQNQMQQRLPRRQPLLQANRVQYGFQSRVFQQNPNIPPAPQQLTVAPQQLAMMSPQNPNETQFNPQFLPQEVEYQTKQKPGTLVIDTNNRFLYLVKEGGMALRYGVGVGKPGFEWAGVHRITKKAEWPGWTPPPEMIAREAAKGHILPAHMEGGLDNPLGSRALYLGNTAYRIHGTNAPWSIGYAVSSGCIRMRNQDVEDLYERVPVGTKVIVQ